MSLVAGDGGSRGVKHESSRPVAWSGLAVVDCSQPFEGVTVNRNDTAERPGGEVTRVRRGRVTITAVDPTTSTVSFVGPNNVPRTVTALNPEVRSFIRGLHVGQQVDIVYEDALAVSVEPMK